MDFPNTIECEGISILTKEFGAIMTSSPIFMLPTITAPTPTPIHTLLPIVGVPFRLPRVSCPIVTPYEYCNFYQ